MTDCPHCHRARHPGSACQPSLLAPMPDWRLDLEQRLELYRERQRERAAPGRRPREIRARQEPAAGLPTPTVEPAPAAVIVFPPCAGSRDGQSKPVATQVVLRTTISAQTAPRGDDADQEPAHGAAALEPPASSAGDEVPWERMNAASPQAASPESAKASRRQAASEDGSRPLDRTLRAVGPMRVERAGPALLQIPLPLRVPETAPSAVRLPVAAAELRRNAGICDAAIILVASGLFGLSVWITMGSPTTTQLDFITLKHLLPALAGVPAALAALYFLLCFSTGAATLGMRRAGLRLRSLDGPLTPEALRRRAWACCFSLAALGLGFVWIYCDGQGLAWHDYMSRTYPEAVRGNLETPRAERGSVRPQAAGGLGTPGNVAGQRSPSSSDQRERPSKKRRATPASENAPTRAPADARAAHRDAEAEVRRRP